MVIEDHHKTSQLGKEKPKSGMKKKRERLDLKNKTNDKSNEKESSYS